LPLSYFRIFFLHKSLYRIKSMYSTTNKQCTIRMGERQWP
jgi:hypothetical protein